MGGVHVRSADSDGAHADQNFARGRCGHLRFVDLYDAGGGNDDLPVSGTRHLFSQAPVLAAPGASEVKIALAPPAPTEHPPPTAYSHRTPGGERLRLEATRRPRLAGTGRPNHALGQGKGLLIGYTDGDVVGGDWHLRQGVNDEAPKAGTAPGISSALSQIVGVELAGDLV